MSDPSLRAVVPKDNLERKVHVCLQHVRVRLVGAVFRGSPHAVSCGVWRMDYRLGQLQKAKLFVDGVVLRKVFRLSSNQWRKYMSTSK